MKTSSIDRLLSELEKLRIATLVIQVLLAFAIAFFSWKLLQEVREKYLFEYAAFWFFSTAAIVLFLLTQSVAIYRANTEIQTARRLDEEYQLKDRIGTYVELRNSSHPFLNAIREDTKQHISEVPVWKAAHLERGTVGPLGLCALLILLLAILPYLPVPESI